MKRLLLFAFLLLGGGGCISKQTGQPIEELPWRVGRTTPRDVVAQWGNPDKITGSTWIWQDVRSIGGKFRAAYFAVGVTLSNARVSTVSYRLTFDDTGRLTKCEAVESVPGGTSWSIWPW